LRSASLPVVGAILAPVTRRRRYKCTECNWTGWKHRLRRRSGSGGTDMGGSAMSSGAMYFSAVVVLFVLVLAGMLVGNCGMVSLTNREAGASVPQPPGPPA
jgi:hypothetical protein